MRAPYTQLYVHLIWSTWKRMPLIEAGFEGALYAALARKCEALKCEAIAIGGIEDHVHLLVRLHPAVSIARLAQNVKGYSSHFMAHEVAVPDEFFKWQGAYRAFTIRKSEVPAVSAYIQNQKQHHREKSLHKEWEDFGEDSD